MDPGGGGRGGGGGGGGGGTAGPDPSPMKNKKNIGFPASPKITKLRNQYSMLGQHRYASKTPFKIGVSLSG